MKRLRISPLATGCLLTLIGLNIACLLWVARISSGENTIRLSPVAWTPKTETSLIDAADARKSADAYPEILTRPIFFRERRPFVPPPPAPPPEPPQVSPEPVFVLPPPPSITNPDLIVSGVALTGDAKQAFLVTPSDTNGSWVREGEEFMGWQINRITSAGVTINKAGHSFDLLLYEPAAQN